jgi:hypothetical protein
MWYGQVNNMENKPVMTLTDIIKDTFGFIKKTFGRFE